MRGSSMAVVLWLAIAPPALLAASGPPDALRAQLKHGIDPSGKTGYLKKRFVGGPFVVIPEAVLEQDLGSDGPWARDRRAFVVLGPDGYSWNFRYDRTRGVPTYRQGPEVLEVDAPEAMAFAPVVDIYENDGL